MLGFSRIGRRRRSRTTLRSTICEKHGRWLPFAVRSRHPVRSEGYYPRVLICVSGSDASCHHGLKGHCGGSDIASDVSVAIAIAIAIAIGIETSESVAPTSIAIAIPIAIAIVVPGLVACPQFLTPLSPAIVKPVSKRVRTARADRAVG